MDLSEDGFEVDSVGDAGSVDDIQEVCERIGYLDQILILRYFLELSQFFSDQFYPEFPGRLVHKAGGGTGEDSEPVVELLDHPLL